MRHVNALECIDFYKAGHRQQYPKGTELVVSNFTPRSGKHANVADKSGIIFFGLQYFIKDFLQDRFNLSFFDLPKELAVQEYKDLMDLSLGVGAIPIDHIEALHDLGYLPIEIKAVPEGTKVPVGIPCLTIHNTHPDFFWLTNYLETVLSAYLWMPCTSATTAHNYRQLVNKFATLTGSPAWFPDWQCHDFSMRGQSSLESAIVSGAAHLTSFMGTDTVPAIRFLKKYYGAEGQVGGSVAATEHSVMCAGGEEDELGTFHRLICEIYPKGIVSIVSDTWDFWKVLTEYAPALKNNILARDGKVVFRPDSGDPYEILVGMKEDDYVFTAFEHKRYHESSEAQKKGAVEVLWDIFGGTVTETGHKLLDSHVGLIYGDSITYELAERILKGLEAKGFASANVVFGVGSYTYQYVTRDTWGWAVKATYVKVKGIGRDIFKKPKTDSGEKNSAKGLLFVDESPTGRLLLKEQSTWNEFISPENKLGLVFRDGKIIREETLEGIRARLK